MRELVAETLTSEAFRPYGDVIEAADHARQIPINYGNTTRFHDLAAVEVTAKDGKVGVSIFRSTPLAQPVTVEVMEYHPLSSQAFIPMGPNPYLVVVAEKGEFDVANVKAFLAQAGQGVNYHAGTWHHFSLALDGISDFLVIDRIGDGDNCVEHHLSADEQVRLVLP